ncbi:gastrula zinc finger protein XlCGF17.1-like [Trichoplusia ni]|uniref:Gastrula zinc finger protein XlCGF17.1-like n=1 Tax=Trichoplusia ni TaxID=7111 RepID=A0A7E5VLL1_TRINI|nr:gastrula zinc finger protein XlCGF17.1-like [Trichoplusia ni]
MSGSYFMLKFLEGSSFKAQQQNLNKLYPSTSYNMDENTNSGNNKCRICLKDATILIYPSMSRLDIAESIRTFAGIEISETDVHSKHLCKSCYNFLRNATIFRQLAQDTDKFLRQLSSHNSDEDLDNRADGKATCTDDQKSLIYTCKLCKTNFPTFTELLAHKNSNTHKKVRVQCPVCFRLLTAHSYKKHLARHQSASHLVCDVCGKLYRKDNLVRHLQLHSFELPYECQECPYRGRFMESLKIHMRTHTGDKPFSCNKCELRFLTRSNLNRHLLTHNKDKPFKCVECERGFYSKRDMDVHFKSDHAGLKEFCCRLCGNKYSTRKALMRHELRVHKRDKMAKGRMPLYLQAEYQKCTETT